MGGGKGGEMRGCETAADGTFYPASGKLKYAFCVEFVAKRRRNRHPLNALIAGYRRRHLKSS